MPIPASQIRTAELQEKRKLLREKRLELNHLAHFRTGHELTAHQRATRLQQLRTEVMAIDNEIGDLVSRERNRIRSLGVAHQISRPNPFRDTF